MPSLVMYSSPSSDIIREDPELFFLQMEAAEMASVLLRKTFISKYLFYFNETLDSGTFKKRRNDE